jgi:hypothetical protein
MAGFCGGTRFCQRDVEADSEYCGFETDTSICLQEKTATLIDRNWQSTGVAVGYGPRNFELLCSFGYAIPLCAKLDGIPKIFALC